MNTVANVLNILEANVEDLTTGLAHQLLKKKEVVYNVGNIILSARSLWIVKKYVYHLLGVKHVSDLHVCSFNGTTASDTFHYRNSDKHMEFSLTEASLQYLKNVSVNGILQKETGVKPVYFIYNIDLNQQMRIKNIMERNKNALFILYSNSSSTPFQPHLRDVGMVVPINISKDVAYNTYLKNYGAWGHQEPITVETFNKIYSASHNDIMNCYLKMLKTQEENYSTSIERAFDDFTEKCMQKMNHYEMIQNARTMSYKLYHMNYTIPIMAFELIQRLILLKRRCNFANENAEDNAKFSPYIKEFVDFLAEYEHMSVITKRDVLTYEAILVKYIQMVYYICQQSQKRAKKELRGKKESVTDTPIKKKRVVKKTEEPSTPKKRLIKKKIENDDVAVQEIAKQVDTISLDTETTKKKKIIVRKKKTMDT